MKKFYKVADLVVQMDSFGRSVEQGKPYAIDGEHTPDIVIKTDWQSLKASQPHLTEEDCEYLCTGGSFYRQLINFDGLLIHSSAVVVDGRAYLFSAPCGTGKSTHTALWLKHFGDRATLLNDDKPALRCIDGIWYAYGTPWSGKYDKSANIRVAVAGICVLRRGEENKIEPYTGFRAVHDLLEQTTRSRSPEFMEKMLSLLDRLIRGVPVWRMECNMDISSAIMSHAVMSGEMSK